MAVTTGFFLNHRGRKKNFDATDGNKFDLSVKKIFPLYLLGRVPHQPEKVLQKALRSHHPHPLVLAMAIALMIMSRNILRIPTRNSTNRATAAVSPITRYMGTSW
jgi:hypothetical protein